MRSIIASILPLFLSLFSLAVAQEAGGSGAPFITAPSPTPGSIIAGTPTATAQVSGPVSQGAASSQVVISGTRSSDPSSPSSAAVAATAATSIITSAGSPPSSGGLILDSTGTPSQTGASQAGTTVTHTGTATAAGNIAPTTRPGSWQSWLAVMVGGVAVAAGLM